jgi:hypothetical protein
MSSAPLPWKIKVVEPIALGRRNASSRIFAPATRAIRAVEQNRRRRRVVRLLEHL